jgi:hypothetical protein
MKARAITFLVVLAGLLMICGSVSAHHGGAGWDRTTTLNLKATITEFTFTNPHIQISFDAPDDKGNIGHWVAEGGSPAGLVRLGWSRTILKPGDQVTIVCNPAKNGSKIIALVKVILANGQELSPRPSDAQ